MAIGKDNSRATSYELEVLTLVNNEGDGFDIRNQLIQCKIYESITANFLIGNIVIDDGINLFEKAKIFGQESLRIKYSQPAGLNDEVDPDDVIDKTFRVYKVDEVTKVDQDRTLFRLHFCAPELLQSKRIRVSQAFRGNLSDIVAGLCEQYLDIKNEIIPSDSHFEIREKSSGDNFHVVVPNYTLSYAINYLCRQAQGTDAESGLQDSFFFFQTANGNFRLQSLDSMLKIKYAGNRPFAYTETREDNPKDIPADKTDEGLVGVGRKILSYKVGISADVLKGITQGLFASKQTTIDTTFKYFSERSYNFLEKFYAGKDSAIDIYPFVRTAPESIYKGGSAGEGQDVPILGAKTLDSIGSYTDANILLKSDTQFVHNEENKIVQVGYDAAQGSDQFRQAAKQLLEYHTVSAVLSARTDISVGQIINLQIPVSSQGEDNIDPFFYNGDHLITEIMWKLTPSDCETHIKCIKDSVINHIETTQVEYGKSI